MTEEGASPKASEIEVFKDKLHRLELQLKSKEIEHTNEVEDFRDEVAGLQQVIAQLEKGKSDLQGQIKWINSQYEESQADLMDKSAEVEKLKADLEMERKMHIKLNGTTLEPPASNKELEVYKTANEELRSKIKHLETMVMNQSIRLNEKEERVKECEELIQNLRETLEIKVNSIQELNEKLKVQEERFSENMNAALQSQNIVEIDDYGRGNSLFSEVESRRIKVEEELTRLRDKIKLLTEENAKLTAKLGKGDHKSGVILTQLQAVQKSQDNLMTEISKWQADKIRHVERMHQRIERLREEYQTKLQKISNNVNPSELKLGEERDQLLMQNISLNREILLLKRDLKIQNHLKLESQAGQIIKAVRNEKESTGENNGMSHNNDIMSTDPIEGCKQQ